MRGKINFSESRESVHRTDLFCNPFTSLCQYEGITFVCLCVINESLNHSFNRFVFHNPNKTYYS